MALPAPMLDPEAPIDPARAARRRRLRVAWYALGLVLLAVAVYMIWRQRGAMSTSWEALRSASPVLIAAIALSPIVNWVLTSAVYWLATRRYGEVGKLEMAGLIASSWLFNLLPMRPGLLGRVAYHKAVNGIAVRDSAWALLQVIIATGITAVLFGTGCLAVGLLSSAAWLGETGLVVAGTFIVTLPAAGLVAVSRQGLSARTAAAAKDPGLAARAKRDFYLAAAIRYVELLVWTGRYWLVFTAIDVPLPLWQLGVIVAVSQAAGMLPIQLGTREWLVGITAGLMAGLGLPGAGATTAQGLLADIIKRAAEIVVSVPLGLVSTAWLVRRQRRVSAGSAGLGAPGEGDSGKVQ